MNCIFCDAGKTNVTNSRSRGYEIWRRRQCGQCSSVWTTRETVDYSTSHRISNTSSEQLRPLQRDDTLFMIRDSLQHRKDAESAASELTDTVLSKVLALHSSNISEKDLNRIIAETLKAYDPTAAAVFKAQNN